jgi:alanine dehydrogenase
MEVGVPTEIKDQERRVALTPAGVRELIARGHRVVVQAGAGAGAGFEDAAYSHEGALLVTTADEVFAAAELILKVKEPQSSEVALLQPHHVLFTYLHLAAAPELARALADSGATCIAYETVEASDGSLPLLAPMSEIAGRLAAQVAASSLTAPGGGRGRLVGAVPGVEPARVVVLGGGAAGTHAAQVAAGMGADVTLLELSPTRLRALASDTGGRVVTRYSTSLAVDEVVDGADVVIGTVLEGGARPEGAQTPSPVDDAARRWRSRCPRASPACRATSALTSRSPTTSTRTRSSGGWCPRARFRTRRTWPSFPGCTRASTSCR